jgi:hypothetical protein
VPHRRRLAPLLAAAVAASACCASSAQALEFAPFAGSPLTVAQPNDVAVVDVDLDGQPEVVVADGTGEWAPVYKRDGGGAFTLVTTAYTGPSPWQIAFGDFVVTAPRSFPDLLAWGVDGLWTTTGFGATFGNSGLVTPPGVTDVTRMEPADLDGDGRPELVVLDATARQVLAFSRNGGSGAWEPRGQFAVPDGSRDMALGDFDGDGRLDVAVTSTDPAQVTVAHGDGAGGFGTPASAWFPAQGAYSLVAGDFDEDGRDDVAATQRGSAGISILLSDGAGGFTTAPTPVVGNGPEVLESGDLNGDGHVDLLTMPSFRGELALVLGDGDGGFTRARMTGVSFTGNPYATLADLDGDGLADLLVRAPGGVQLLRNVTARAAATVPPSISGTPELGATLTCDPGEWSGSEPLTVTVGWLRDGEPIPGETEETYTLGESDRGRTVACAATGANELLPVTVASPGVTLPGPPVDPPVPPVDPPVGPPARPAAPGTPRIDAAPPALGRGRTVTLRFSGAPAFECRLDDEPWAPCSSPHTVSGLRAGDHTVAVRGIAADGTRGTAATVVFQVNPYAPGVRVGSAKLHASRGVVPVRLTCSPREGEGRGACRGTVTLRGGGAKPRTLGRASFGMAAGRTTTARVRLTRAGRRALRTAGRALTVRVVVRAQDLAGNAGTSSRRATVR